MPSPAAFERDYARIGKPVIITNLIAKTKAAKKWTPDYLIKTVGAQKITITKLRNGKLRSDNRLFTVPFDEYATSAFAGDLDAAKYCAQQIPLPKAIAHDLPTPELVGTWVRVPPRLWLSTPGHVTETHRDSNHNLLVQVIGSKSLTLFSPVFAHAMYVHHPRTRRARYSRVDMDRPDLFRFPAARELAATEVTLNAGETLFLPIYWWHRVRTMEPSVSVNFWWAPPLNLSLHSELFPRATPEEVFKAIHSLADLSAFPSEFDVALYLWDQGFADVSAAYLHHCISLLVTTAGGNGVAARNDVRAILRSCSGGVKSLANGRRRGRTEITDMDSLVSSARKIAAKLKCGGQFRPSRWVPLRPFED